MPIGVVDDLSNSTESVHWHLSAHTIVVGFMMFYTGFSRTNRRRRAAVRSCRSYKLLGRERGTRELPFDEYQEHGICLVRISVTC